MRFNLIFQLDDLLNPPIVSPGASRQLQKGGGHLHRGVDMVFRPPHTGTYTFAVQNESLPSDTWRASVAVAVSYR